MNSPGVHPAAIGPEALAVDCETTFTRRSGPGGQNRNKVETAVVLRHRPTGIGAEASERRSQGENLKEAIFRLRLNLALQIRLGANTPSALWLSRCRGARIVISPTHDDFPSLLAEALDIVQYSGMDIKNAALVLGCTTTQLTRFLKIEPRAFLHVNQGRALRGLRVLL